MKAKKLEQTQVSQQAPANDLGVAGVDTGKATPNKLLTRKRRRSRHPLRELRLQRGFTLEELSAITGMSPSYLSRLESGSRRLNADILTKLSTSLGCHPGDLLMIEAQNAKFASPTQRMGADNADASLGRYPAQDLPLHVFGGKNPMEHTLTIDQTYEYISRPPELLGVAGAIAIVINDDSYGPRYRAGDRVFAHPTRPLAPQCTILAVTHDHTAYMGEFVGWKQENPNSQEELVICMPASTKNKEVRLANDQVRAIYRIIGSIEAA